MPGEASLKNRIWEILEPPAADDRLSRLFDVFMIALILASVGGVIVRTVPSVVAEHLAALRLIEFGSVAVFTLEIVLRLWVADLTFALEVGSSRARYLRSAEGVIDLVAVVPFYLALLWPTWTPILAGIALLRIFKLLRYSPALATLVAVVVNERKVLLGALTIMLVLALFSSTAVYLVERSVQPEKFGSIPAAMWWGIATLTTVGYGDVTPVTPLGKLFGAMVTILGIGMFALPAGILSSGFAREMKQRELLKTWKLVHGVPLFSDLGAHDVASISRLLHPMVVQAGHVIVRAGEEALGMFFVSDGELEVEIGGQRKRLEADFFGEIALLEGGVRSATIRALTRCQLLMLERSNFHALMTANPRIERGVRAVAAERKQADERRGVSGPESGDEPRG